ncbi:MAG: PAS domain S-box protein [Prolixibacteraceae bacterium]|nr:PAS domain S-box protein [Prolixibacteraceae bacterium]
MGNSIREDKVNVAGKDHSNRELPSVRESAVECESQIVELKKREAEQEILITQLTNEKELAESQLRIHKNFYKFAPSGYLTLNKAGIILELNESAARFLEKDVVDLKGQKLQSFLDGYSVFACDQFLTDIFMSGKKIGTTIALKKKQGIPVNILVEGIAIPETDECLVDMVDIVGRIKILDQLTESELRYRSLLDNLNEGIGMLDMDGIFTYANSAGEAIFGTAPGTLRNRKIMDFICSGQAELIRLESLKRDQGESSRFELEIVTPSQSIKTVLVSVTPHKNRDGKLVGSLNMFSDITRQKAGEREIQRRLKLELIISEISNDFVHLRKEYLDLSVNRALHKIGRFAGVDRSYIFLFTEDGLFCDNTHEWCDEGIEPQIENLQGIPVDLMPWWMDKLRKFETIHIPAVSELPAEAQSEKEILEAQGIKSLLVIPLLTSDGVIGFLGFDSVVEAKIWENQDILILTTLGEILGNGFGRLKYEENLVRVNTQLEQKVEERTLHIRQLLELNRAIVDNVGLIVMSTDRQGIIRSFNPFAQKMLGYDAEEVVGCYTPLLFHEPNDFINLTGTEIRDEDKTGHEGFNLQALLGLNDNKYTESSEWVYLSKLGKKINVLLSVNELVGGNSETDGYAVVAIDITDRKLAEREQFKTRQNLMFLIQNLRAGTLFEDENRRVFLVNQSFCNLFNIGLDPGSLVGVDCSAASEAAKHLMKDPEEFIRGIEKTVSEGKALINEELYLVDGKVYERDYIPILDNNDLLGHLWQYRDISERKQNEQYAILQRDLGFSLAATSTIDQALSQVIQATMKIDGVHGAGIYIFNKLTDKLELVCHQGLSDSFIKSVTEYDKDDLQFQIVFKGEPVYGNYSDLIAEPVKTGTGQFKQLGVVPIKHEGRIIGSVNIGSMANENLNYSAKISLEIISSQIGGTLARIDMENALRLSQKNFHLMFDTIDDFMFILDIQGKIIKTNPVVERRLGYLQEELAEMSVLQIHPPDRRDEAALIVNKMLAGEVDYCPIPLLAKNGNLIPVETKVVSGKWDGKEALYGISRDISERIKAEETLRESEQRWHFALEGSGDGVWDWNARTSEVYFSNQWKAMLGYSGSEIGNRLDEWEKRVHPDDLEKCLSDLQKNFSGETEIYMNEHRMLCKDGSYKWIFDRGKVVEWTDDKKPVRVIGTHSDITPRKNLEEHLRQAIEKEKELNELKSRFVSTASHEFRTPLASILMVSETLIAYQHKMDEAQISSRLIKIKDQVLHLNDIVNDVLQLSKMQEGKIGINLQEEDIVALCQKIIEGFNTTILLKGSIEFFSSFKVLRAKIDNRQITQSLGNLLSNAIKYSDKDPRISVRLGKNNEGWFIQVSDNGIGIPEADQKHLFKPFFRAGNVSTIQGNGLGLSIVMESVQMHGGRITFESKPTSGSNFTLHFPEQSITEVNFA